MGKITNPYDKRLEGKGLGTHGDTYAISAKFSPEVDAILRKMGRLKGDFIREAVNEKLKAEGLI